MFISYVLRLRSDALADGRFVGEIEAVTSRERGLVRTVDQVANFVLATMPAQILASDAARESDGGGHDVPRLAVTREREEAP